MTREEKAIVREEYSKVWGAKMIDYCTNKADVVIVLSDGSVYVIDKEKIQKDFCFGYHDYDEESYNNANEMTEVARNSHDYFRRANLEALETRLNQFKSNDRKHVIIKNYEMYPDCKIVVVSHIRPWEQEENGIELSEADRLAIIAGYEKAIEHMNRRLDTYLKKYGTSKVNSRSFWMDE